MPLYLIVYIHSKSTSVSWLHGFSSSFACKLAYSEEKNIVATAILVLVAMLMHVAALKVLALSEIIFLGRSLLAANISSGSE